MINLLILHPHILWIDVASADWADIVSVKPCDDAFLVECVAHVTSQWGNLISLLEVNEADDTVCDAPESASVVSDFGSLVNHTLSRLSLPVLILAVRAIWVDDAWAENDTDCDSNHDNKGLREDEADDNREHSETEAGIWVVAMWRKAIECVQDVDGPSSV